VFYASKYLKFLRRRREEKKTTKARRNFMRVKKGKNKWAHFSDVNFRRKETISGERSRTAQKGCPFN
jgi:hypothetical protein